MNSHVERAEDAYTYAADGWAGATSQVYQPLADALVRHAPHDLAGRLVLDAGAGTGCGGTALTAAGARVISTDLSEGMLHYQHRSRPPAAVCDICRMALADDSVDDAIVPFVLNHLAEPVAALTEMKRVVRSGGAVLASIYSNASHSEARDRIDQIAVDRGFVAPEWYRLLKASATSIGTAENLAATTQAAGLAAVRVDETAVDTGVVSPTELVDYRLSMAQYTTWVAGLDDAAKAQLWQQALHAAGPVMTPYRPIVLFLTATL